MIRIFLPFRCYKRPACMSKSQRSELVCLSNISVDICPLGFIVGDLCQTTEVPTFVCMIILRAPKVSTALKGLKIWSVLTINDFNDYRSVRRGRYDKVRERILHNHYSCVRNSFSSLHWRSYYLFIGCRFFHLYDGFQIYTSIF